MAPPKDIARSYPKRGLTADVGFRSEPKFCGDGSVYFDGSSDYAETAASTDLAVGDTFTLTAWVWLNPNPGGASKYALRVGDTGAAAPNIASIGVFGGANPAFYCYNGSSNMSSSVTCDSARWYHVASVIKSGAGNSQLFVDGIDVTNSHSTVFNVTSTSSKIRIGDWTSGANDWEGYIANACLFTESLTEDQVRQVMRASDYASHAAISTVEAFYPLSANFNDSTGSHNATLTGSVSFGVNRPQLPRGLDLARGAAQARVYTGRAVDFDGSVDHLDAAVYSNSSDYFSVSVWVKPDAIGANRNIVASGDTGDNVFLLFLYSSGEVGFYGNDTTGDYGLTHQTTLSAGRWYHLAMVVDQSDAADNTIKAYVDGVENTTSKSAQPWFGNASALEIAARNSTTLFDGAIAGLKVFNSELTAAQVRELYHNPEQVLPTGVSASNLRRYYPLSDYNDTGGTGGRWFQDMGADGEPAEDQGSCTMAFAQPVPCPQLGLQQSATRVYFERNSTRAQATLGAAPGTACTMSAWVMVDEQFPFQYFMKNGTSIAANEFFAFAIDTNRRLYAVQSSNIQAEGSLALSDYGEWNHVVAMTKSTAPYVRFFVNGVEDTSITDNGMVAFNLTSTAIDIGGDGGSNNLKGFLNDCAIWDVELSDPEVAALYNSGVQGMDVSTVQSANLKGWWKCDDLTTFKDYSGNGANATMIVTVADPLAASFPENASGSTIVGDFSMKRKGVSVLNPTATPLVTGVTPGAQIANDGSLNPDPANGGFTASAFIRFEMQAASVTFLPTVFGNAVQPASGKDWHLCIFPGNVTSTPLRIQLGDGSTTYRTYSWPSVLSNPEQWHHIAYTIDYSTSPTTFRLYQDGALVSTQATYTHLAINTGDMNVGAYWSGNGNFPGAIACVKMYQAKLSDDEVEQIYRSDLRLIKGLANE